MKLWQKTLGVFRALLRKEKLDREMDEEMRLHLEMRTHANVEVGMPLEEARYAALRSFGGVEQTKEACRDLRGVGWIAALWRDARCGCRVLRKDWGFATVSVLTLGLGIGGTTAIFSMAYGVLLRPLGYPDPQQLVFIGESIPALTHILPVFPVPGPHVLEWKQRCSSFQDLGLLVRGDRIMTGAGDPERLETLEVPASLFDTLRVAPALGRLLTAADEEQGNRVAVISDGLWRRNFSGAPSVVGKTVRLDSEPYTVVGVLPSTFRFPNVNLVNSEQFETSAQPSMYLPKVLTPKERNEPMTNFRFTVIGRLKAGITPEQATADLNVIVAQIAEHAGKKDLWVRAIVEPLKEALVHNSRRGLLVLLAAIGTLLLTVCLNSSVLGLVRAEQREPELAVRAAPCSAHCLGLRLPYKGSRY